MDLQTVAKNLTERGYTAHVFETSKDCQSYLTEQLHSTTIGMGGSVTINQLNLYPLLKERNVVFWHGDKEQTSLFGNKVVRDLAIDTKAYITSVNGMSEDGVIINIDYTGNRIGATCYGHEKVYLLVGKNKIAPSFEQALWRARNIASPKNAQRLGRKTPCALHADKCYDCKSPDRICNGFLVFDRAMAGTQTEVLLINEDLGY